MKSFLEYYKEEKKKKLKEDMILKTEISNNANTSDVISSKNSTNQNCDILSTQKITGVTQGSVLGKLDKKKKFNGFFGKDDFFKPQSVLSSDFTNRLS